MVISSSSPSFLMEINHIHNKLVKRGYVNKAKHWRYTSDYEGILELLEVERLW